VSRTLSVGVLGACLAVAAVVVPGRASLHQPDEPALSVPVKPDGTGEPFPFDRFKIQLVRLTNQRNPGLKDAQGKNPDREHVLARVKPLRQQAKTLPTPELTALAADLLRLGNSDAGFFVDEAINLLKPRTGERAPYYFVFTTLAQLHAARGEWAEALTNQQAIQFGDAVMPAEVKGLTKAQRDWQAKLDLGYVLHYYALHKREAEARPRPGPETEEPTPLFPLPVRDVPHHPVRFVNNAGQYEPGTLAVAERDKLPPDAIAVVQQLLLWFPADTRLYWLLGELYAAEGKLEEAQKIFDECVSEARQYGNRKLLNAHRTALRPAAEAHARATEEAERKASEEAEAKAKEEAERKKRENEQNALANFPISLRTVGIYFGAVVVLAILAAVRVISRRARGNGGPSR
jgi:tetratricopeptide (TPR) repeat protein